jgi:3-hydroxybutyryl-CoA dehydrogenase
VTASAWPARVAVVGAGTMGVGIAQAFATHAVTTVLVDASPELSDAARESAVALLARLEAAGNVAPGSTETGERHLTAAVSIAGAVADADLVVEAVFERPDAKERAYREIEAGARDDAVIATNTSSIPITQLAAAMRLPQRFLGVHWFVPALLVPCVEVIPTASTDAAVVDRVLGALTALGKIAVVVGDAPGFVANRIQFAMFREAARIVEEGVATPEQVDEIVRSSFGFRLPFFGPFAIADMAGLDVYADIFETLERSLGEGFSAPAALRERVARGEYGVKAGRGFLELSEEQARELIDRRDSAYVALARLRAEGAP